MSTFVEESGENSGQNTISKKRKKTSKVWSFFHLVPATEEKPVDDSSPSRKTMVLPRKLICTKNNVRDDVLFEILMKTDPSDIFKCILVSKDWFSVIASPLFRTHYLSKWKDSPANKIVGLLSSQWWESRQKPARLQLLATSNLGENINMNLKPQLDRIGIGFFISKSPKGGLLLFCNSDRTRWCVCKSISKGSPLELPPPPIRYAGCKANIISFNDDGAEFKVILVGIRRYIFDSELGIQEYCSQLGKWEQSRLTCSTPIRMGPYCVSDFLEGGTVSRGGDAIYWKAIIATNDLEGKVNNRYTAKWDMKGNCIKLFPNLPASYLSYCAYVVSPLPHYSLLAASYLYYSPYVWKNFKVQIWALDDETKEWSLLHSVMQVSLWNNNLQLLQPLYKSRPKSGFIFVSFVPGKSDSLFLALEKHLFIFDFHTGKLEYVDYVKYGFSMEDDEFSFVREPLTMLDLGIWPCLPPAKQFYDIGRG